MSELITKDTPEPLDADVVFISDKHGLTVAVFGEYGWVRTGGTEDSWNDLANDYIGSTIESLAEHDARIRREALTATDEELAVMEEAFDASINDREDDGIGAMGIAMKSLAKSRELES